jgi:glutamate synthase domain-containing protein 3
VVEVTLDAARLGTREINSALRSLPVGGRAKVVNPAGRHNLAVGLDRRVRIDIDGPAGYYVGGLSKYADILVHGPVGWGVGENLMSGNIRVRGNASQSAAASARGGMIVVEGDCSLRAGISLKGATLAIAGDAGAYCGFLAQSGVILIGGDAGDGLGDSLYEATIYVAGKIKGLGADARTEEVGENDATAVKILAAACGFDHIKPETVTKVTSARRLYHFDTHDHGAY